MKTEMPNLETAADNRADVFSWKCVWAFALLSWVVLSTNIQIEAHRSGNTVNWLEPWLTEGTSHLAMMICALIIPFMLSRWPLTLENWKRKWPVFAFGLLVYSGLHICLFYGFRSLSFPVFLGRSFGESLLDINFWIYEFRKDAYAYLLILSIFLTSRQLEQSRLELKHARTEARTSGRISLKSGGRTLFLNSDEILWAEAASNYLEIHTEAGSHLVRMTLSALEILLTDAGGAHVRIHRSHLVLRAAIREVIPTGDGGAVAKLLSGQTLAMSRKYRNALE